MQFRSLGRSDLKVSAVGMGCVTFGREIDVSASYGVMDRAFEVGINLFDTAEWYHSGVSEEVVGKWMAERGVRDRVVLATKVGGKHIPGGITRDRVVSSAEASLKRLKTDYIDLYMVHLWDETTPLEETLRGLEELVSQGKARAVGCSNFAAWQLCKALWQADVNGWTRMEAVEPNYNLVAREIESELFPLCHDQEIGVITYSPVGAGFLTGKYLNEKLPKGARFDLMPGHQDVYFHDQKFAVVSQLLSIADEAGISPVQLALRWVFSRPDITSTLVGARSTAHVDQAVEALITPLEITLREKLSAISTI